MLDLNPFLMPKPPVEGVDRFSGFIENKKQEKFW